MHFQLFAQGIYYIEEEVDDGMQSSDDYDNRQCKSSIQSGGLSPYEI